MTSLLLMLLLLAPGSAQNEIQAETWEKLKYFLGSWVGHETGRAGIGKGERTYQMLFDGRYLHADNTSTFEPQEKNPNGEVHREWGFFSYDKGRERVVLREFHSEGYVIQYTLQQQNPNRYVFVSEAVENGPPGLRARLTLRIHGEDEFEETFELAMPEGEFTEFIRNRWKRIAR